MLEREVMQKCVGIFENLGWDVRTEEVFELGRHNPFRHDIVLRHNGEIYGFVEVIGSDNLMHKAKVVKSLLDTVIKEMKPRIFVITNGFSYDLYLPNEFYGSLTIPPTPEEMALLLGGETNG